MANFANDSDSVQQAIRCKCSSRQDSNLEQFCLQRLDSLRQLKEERHARHMGTGASAWLHACSGYLVDALTCQKGSFGWCAGVRDPEGQAVGRWDQRPPGRCALQMQGNSGRDRLVAYAEHSVSTE